MDNSQGGGGIGSWRFDCGAGRAPHKLPLCCMELLRIDGITPLIGKVIRIYRPKLVQARDLTGADKERGKHAAWLI